VTEIFNWDDVLTGSILQKVPQRNWMEFYLLIDKLGIHARGYIIPEYLGDGWQTTVYRSQLDWIVDHVLDGLPVKTLTGDSGDPEMVELKIYFTKKPRVVFE
jgi:hypothetical protein